MSASSAFVAGATGFTGREVVRFLREAQVRVIAHVRPDSSELMRWRTYFGQLGAEVDTTSWEKLAMTDTLKRLKPAMVFALIGTTKKRGRRAATSGRPAEDYLTVDYGLTKILLDATVSSSAAPPPRFVYLSAAGTSSGSASSYTQARWKAEEDIRTSGLPYTIGRPSFIVGSDRDEPRPAERAGAALVDGLLVAAGALGFKRTRDRYRSTSNTVLAQSLVRLALDRAAADHTFESEDLRA